MRAACCSVALLCSGIFAGACASALAESSSGSDLKVVGFRDMVKSSHAARPRWSADGKWLYYDDRGKKSDKFVIFRKSYDESTTEPLTWFCRSPKFANSGGGNLDRTGRYMVFSGETLEHAKLPQHLRHAAGPGGGIFNDVWVMDLEKPAFHKLTAVANGKGKDIQIGGSLYPRFSPDGKFIAWGDFVGVGRGKRFGKWRLAVAPFLGGTEPRLGPIRYFKPGEDFDLVEVQGWSEDGRSVYFAGAPLRGQDAYAADVCSLDVHSGKCSRITKTSGLNAEPSEFEEHAALQPGGEWLAHMSSAGYGIKDKGSFLVWLKSELWLSRPDGSEARQITFYNKPGSADFAHCRVMVSEMAWHPNGKQLAVRVHYVNKPFNPRDDVSIIRVFEFAQK